MTSHMRGLAWAGLLLVLVHLTGTVGYKLIGGDKASWFDSFYMTFITVATIGFGEILDMSNNTPARAFTVLIGILGAGTLSFLFSTVTVVLVQQVAAVAGSAVVASRSGEHGAERVET